MELKGTVEVDETLYRRALELAFTDYLDDGAQTPELFKDYITDRLSENLVPEFTLDEDIIAQAIDDAKKFVKEALKNI